MYVVLFIINALAGRLSKFGFRGFGRRIDNFT